MRRMRHLKPREIQGCDVAYQPWRPETLYDATTGGSLVAASAAVARCEDVSGNANHMTQGTGGNQPTRRVAAQNGMDALRFDGSDDFMSAGDVADMLGNPVEAYAVFIRTGSDGVKGIFGKSRAFGAAGRWSLLQNSIAGNDNFLFSGSNAASVDALIATSTALQCLYGHCPRGATNVTATRNESTSDARAVVDTGASENTTDILMMGAYQSSSGSTPPLANSYIGADIIECAKYSRTLGEHVRKRVNHAAMRRARIAG